MTEELCDGCVVTEHLHHSIHNFIFSSDFILAAFDAFD